MSYPPLNQEIKNDNCSKKDISLIALKESKYDISDYNSENEINEQNIIIQNYENLKRKNRQRSKSIFTQGRLSNDKYFLDKYKINLMKFQLKIYFILTVKYIYILNYVFLKN